MNNTFKTTDAERMELATILCYGIRWLIDASDDNIEYYRGGLETLGQIAASWICQKEFDGNVSIETGITIEALSIDSDFMPTEKKMKTKIDEYIQSYRE